MSRCTSCNKKTSIATTMTCKWCEKNFCIGCLAIELHSCSGESDCKQAALTDLSNRLTKNKTEDNKLVKI